MTKARFELKKLEEKQAHSVTSSKTKLGNPEDEGASEPNSNNGSKVKQTYVDLNKDDTEKLKERLLCVSCMDKPKCMLITTCKHVPFCEDCDKNWKLRLNEDGKEPECPFCRKTFKRTQKINFV